MPPIRHSNRALEPRAYRRHQPEFIIYTEPPESTPDTLTTQPQEGLNTGLNHDEGLDSSDNEGLDSSDDEGLDFNDDEGLDSNDDEGLDSSNDEGLHPSDNEDLAEDLTEGLIEGLTKDLAKDLITQFCNEIEREDLGRQLYETLGMEYPDDQPYQPLFLPKDRAGKPQNLPENPNPVKLFQLFFPVKEIKNIVKQTNRRARYIDFPLRAPWKPLTITEAYRYLGCLVYIGVQPLRELSDHWGQLKSPVASCFNKHRFWQIQRAFIIRDPKTSPQKPGESWW